MIIQPLEWAKKNSRIFLHFVFIYCSYQTYLLYVVQISSNKYDFDHNKAGDGEDKFK